MAGWGSDNLMALATTISDQQTKLVQVVKELEKLITPVVVGEQLDQQQKTELADLQQHLSDLLAEQQTKIQELNDHAVRLSNLAYSTTPPPPNKTHSDIRQLFSPDYSDVATTTDFDSPAVPAVQRRYPALTQSAQPRVSWPFAHQPPVYSNSAIGSVYPLTLPPPVTLGHALQTQPGAPISSTNAQAAADTGPLPNPVFMKPRTSIGGGAPAGSLGLDRQNSTGQSMRQSQSIGVVESSFTSRHVVGSLGYDTRGQAEYTGVRSKSTQPSSEGFEEGSWWDMVEAEESLAPRSPAWKRPEPASGKKPRSMAMDRLFPALSETVAPTQDEASPPAPPRKLRAREISDARRLQSSRSAGFSLDTATKRSTRSPRLKGSPALRAAMSAGLVPDPSSPGGSPGELLEFLSQCFPDLDPPTILDILEHCDQNTATALEALLQMHDENPYTDDLDFLIGLPPEDVAVYFDDGYVHYEEEETDPSLLHLCAMFEDMELRILKYALEDAGGDSEKAANAILSETYRTSPDKLPEAAPTPAERPSIVSLLHQELQANHVPPEWPKVSMQLRDIKPDCDPQELLALYLDCGRNFEMTANALFAPAEERPKRVASKVSRRSSLELVEATAWSDELGLSDRMNVERLKRRFPDADKEVLQQMYLMNNRDLAATDKELRGMFPSARPPSPVMGASGTAASVLRAPAPSYQATGTKAFTIVIPSKSETLERPDRLPGEVYNQMTQELDEQYSSLRREAQRLAEQRNEMFARAAEAFQSRSGGASYYAEEGRRLDQKFKEANMKAAQSIFLTRNKHHNVAECVDLHGLHVNEAIYYVKCALKAFYKQSTPGVIGKKLRIITGTGTHSQGGKARVKRMVVKYLDDNRHPWKQVSDAIIDVTPRRGALAEL